MGPKGLKHVWLCNMFTFDACHLQYEHAAPFLIAIYFKLFPRFLSLIKFQWFEISYLKTKKIQLC